MEIRFEILGAGDSVINVWENHIAVKKKTGDVEIFEFYLDENNLPRLNENKIIITHGKGSVSARGNDSSIEITTF